MSSVAVAYNSDSIQHTETRRKSSVKKWKVLNDPVVGISVEILTAWGGLCLEQKY